jgi:hypothetical protein
MAQRNQVSRSLGGHDPGQSSYFQHIAFLQVPVTNQLLGFGVHADQSAGDRFTRRYRFATDVDHPAAALVIKVAEWLRHVFVLVYLTANSR